MKKKFKKYLALQGRRLDFNFCIMSKSIAALSIDWANSKQLLQSYTKRLSSTQDVARTEAFSLNSAFKLYVTDEQTQGRGRLRDRSWLSKSEDNFLSTWSWDYSKKNITTLFSRHIAEQVILACQSAWPQLNWQLKLPNDILLNNKKIAGLLIDLLNQADHTRLLIGFGFNIYSCPDNLQNTSTYLNKEDDWHNHWPIFLSHLYNNWDQFICSGGEDRI